MTRKFQVTASHPSPTYQVNRVVELDGSCEGFRVTSSTSSNPAYGTTYHAVASGFGCGRSCSTPEAAIRSLLEANGCTAIVITEMIDPATPIEGEVFNDFPAFRIVNYFWDALGLPEPFGEVLRPATPYSVTTAWMYLTSARLLCGSTFEGN